MISAVDGAARERAPDGLAFDVVQTDDGTIRVATRGLSESLRIELEVAAVPRACTSAAKALLVHVARSLDASRRRGNDLDVDAPLGITLCVEGHEDLGRLFLGVRLATGHPPRGLFARWRGDSRRVVRLVDLLDPHASTPRTALCTMMLHRANELVAAGDVTGAVRELRLSIDAFPGRPSREGPPPLTTGDAQLNWQNHLTYLRLAELLRVPSEQHAVLAYAYARFEWLAWRELGATLDELTADTHDAQLVAEAERVLRTNLARPMHGDGPDGRSFVVASPIWTPSSNGASVRRVVVAPATLVDCYYGEALRAPGVAWELPRIAAACVARNRATPWRIAQLTSGARALFDNPDAAILDLGFPRHPAHTLLSSVLAEAACYLRAGADLDRIRATVDVPLADTFEDDASTSVRARDDRVPSSSQRKLA